MKRVLLCLLVIWAFAAKAQEYNNEWIDYTKTYYKFKVGKTGLYRIPQTVLASAGIGSAPAEQLQLWRNGVQVPVYTSVVSGALPSNGYIEFWGEMNDGRPDNQLYRDPDYQLNDKWSLLTDTAAYFLTVNTSGNNLRLSTTANNVSGNTLPAEPYFMHTIGNYFRDKIHPGYAESVDNQYLYSSSYDKGEGWSSNDISTNASFNLSYSNLKVYAAGPASIFNIAVSGNAFLRRSYLVKINNDSVAGGKINFLNYDKNRTAFSTSLIASNTANIQITNVCAEAGCPTYDRMVIHKYEFTYPRQFDFGGATNFEFSLPASTTGNYLEIANFSYGATAPVLYDITNGKRYVADISSSSLIKVVLQPSALPRRLVLVNEETANINSVTTIQSRNFINYSLAANQGNYLIISNPLLFTGTSSNPVEDYRAYRSSALGGGYNAKIILVDELVDQFGLGIKKNPLAIRNFIRFARAAFSAPPKGVFLIGKGVTYDQQRYNEGNADLEKLNLVPTFGVPASDLLLSADPRSSIPLTPIGRISVINAQEAADYLKKMKEAELAQATLSPKIEDRGWMKNGVHIVGTSEPGLISLLNSYFNRYKQDFTDTLYGGKVYDFTKSTSSTVEQLSTSSFENLMNNGISLITYFGHSATGTLEFNLANPEDYKNTGKYPMFVALGCNSGNLFSFDRSRFVAREGLSEKYVLSPQKGMIGFVASTHFGIVSYLNIWASNFYKSLSRTDYGKPMGDLMNLAAQKSFNVTTQDDFYSRAVIEQLNYHGDPAFKVNTHEKADYVVTDPMVKVSPAFISIAEKSFKVQAKFMNIGKAPDKNIVVEIKRQLPDQTTKVVFRDTIPGIRYEDSISVEIPIDAIKDKGTNKLIVTIDADNNVDEFFETNNSVTKEFIVYEDEARPIYPYPFSIVSQQNIKLAASTANPFSPSKQYRMEIDTTELFNSPVKVANTITSVGGVLEFNPGLTFTNNTVYYWRVGAVPSAGDIKWNNSSFVYLANSDAGFNQSHLYQHFKSTSQNIYMDSATRNWRFVGAVHNLFAKNAIFPTGASQEGDFTVAVDGNPFIRSACVGSSLIFNVFDQTTLKPWKNIDANGNNLFLYGSGSANCSGGRQNNFEFSYMTSQSRKLIMNFMDTIPVGAFVVVRSIDYSWGQVFSDMIKSDRALFGANNSLYDKLLNVGFAAIDSINQPRSWILIYQKGIQGFTPKYAYTNGIYDKTSVSADVVTPSNLGEIFSPQFGPAKSWKELNWDGISLEPSSKDAPTIDVIGITENGTSSVLFNNITLSQKTFSLSAINSKTYPYLQLHMHNVDTVDYTPYQLKYWKVTYDPVPEGAVAPNIYFKMKDTLDAGEPVDFKMAFKNVSATAFDSLKIKAVLTDQNNVQHALPMTKSKPLSANDTLHVQYSIDTKQYLGLNSLYVEVNPDNDQAEQYHFNNFIYKTFYAGLDTLSPVLDVTFDNVHILNNDIVSAKPDIVIHLKDESKWSLLNDTSLIKIQVRYPNGTIRSFNFNSDTVQFTPPAQGASNGNTATVNFKPYFTEDGDYELIVSGKDRGANQAGAIEYKVGFKVINKPMISNLLNYPNPFTTSTAFVFTVTGVELPQNLKIQILTITGKVVREITKEELGPIHIGRNITDFKWDGTDQYGQKVANGVYLYRVTTNLNGKSLDKYASESDNTEKYFNKGYGKMYLMR